MRLSSSDGYISAHVRFGPSSMKISIFAFVVLALGSANATACSVPVRTLDQHVEKAEEIFVATLLKAEVSTSGDIHQRRQIQGHFQISRILKGGLPIGVIKLTTGMGGGDCGIAMVVSAKYLVFKGKDNTGIGDPSGTRAIEHFQEEELIEKIQSAIRKQGRLFERGRPRSAYP